MLKPNKYSHPNRTIIFVALLIISRLRVSRVEKFSCLRNYVKGKVVGGDILFLPALNFLFLIGLVEYRSKTDSLEYMK